MSDAVIVSTARTGLGKSYRGALNNTHSVDIAGHVIKPVSYTHLTLPTKRIV